MALFDMTANTNVRKLMVLNPEFPKDTTVIFPWGGKASAVFEVEIQEHGRPTEYTYQWYIDGNAVAGANSRSYTAEITEPGNRNVYCVVTNKKGSVISRTATLTVLHVPVLNDSYPEDKTILLGNDYTAKVEISTAGVPDSYTYQWYKNGSAVSGATSSSYTFTPSAFGSTTVYCKITTSAGTVTSRTATITVNTAYIYQNGIINTALVGGIAGYAYKPSSHSGEVSKPSVNNGSDVLSVYFSCSGEYDEWGTCCINKAIDLTGVKTISIRVSCSHETYSRGYVRLFVTKSLVNNYAVAAEVKALSNSGITNNVTYSLDVSSLTGTYYVGLYHGFKISVEYKVHEWSLK